MCVCITEAHAQKGILLFENLIMFIFLPVFLNVLWVSNNSV